MDELVVGVTVAITVVNVDVVEEEASWSAARPAGYIALLIDKVPIPEGVSFAS